MLYALTTRLKEVKRFHHNLEFKACVFVTVMSLYHENAVNSHSVGGVHYCDDGRGKAYSLYEETRVCLTAGALVCWSPLIRCFVYSELEVKFIHSANHTENNYYLTRTKHDCTSSHCNFNRNTLVTGQRGGWNFPINNNFQGQLQTPQSVTIQCLHSVFMKWTYRRTDIAVSSHAVCTYF